MAEHVATVRWTRGGREFQGGRYSRAHVWAFDGGLEVPASASPHVVPVPLSDPKGVDPEEAFVASIASCHMLWFLAFAQKERYEVDAYEDDAVGVLGKDSGGRTAVTLVTLRPLATFAGARRPSDEELRELHHRAHAECFIANSVRTEIRCEPRTPPKE